MINSGFQTGVSMFKDSWIGCAKELFFDEISQYLRDLEHNNFEEGEVESFHKVMDIKAKALKNMGHGRRLKWRCELQIFDATLDHHDVDDPKDAAFYQFWCRVTTIAVNQRSISPLFYEELLFPEGRGGKLASKSWHLISLGLHPTFKCIQSQCLGPQIPKTSRSPASMKHTLT